MRPFSFSLPSRLKTTAGFASFHIGIQRKPIQNKALSSPAINDTSADDNDPRAEIYVDKPRSDVVSDRIVSFSGWIASDEPIVSIAVRVNGKEHDRVQTHPRKDVEAVHRGKSIVGWRAFCETETVMTRSQGAITFELIIDGHQALERHYRCDLTALERTKKTDILYYMHIPKTAGSSVRLALETTPSLRTLAVYPDDPFITREQLSAFSSHALDDVDVVFGHFGYGLHRSSSRNHRYVTVMREPHDQVLSYYLYLKYVVKEPWMMRFSSVFEAVESADDIAFDNYTTRYISGYFGRSPASAHHLDQALANIEKDFAYVGRVSKLQDTFLFMSRYLGVDLPHCTDNVTPITDEGKAVDRTRLERLVRLKCPLDTRLHETLASRDWDVVARM